MRWATKRRLQYLGILFLFILLILFWIFYPIIFEKPTCFDGKKNGQESGVDCGGNCSLVCSDEALNPVVVWSRAFNITSSAYNLVAYIENPNKESAIKSVSYEFRVYDDKNNVIEIKTGETFLPANSSFFVFGPRFDSKGSNIRTVVFEFTSDFVWHKKNSIINKLPIYITNISFETSKHSSSLSATINNDSIYNLPEFEAMAILYDKDGNAINASKTYKDKLLERGRAELIFTWPKGFDESLISKKEVVFLVNPFDIDF